MKQFFCFTFVLSLFVGTLQAAETSPIPKAPPVVVVLKGHTSGVLSADFSQDGKKVVTASHDTSVRIWDVDSGKELGNMNPSTLAYRSFGWVDSTIFEPRVFEGAMRVKDAVFSPNGKNIAMAGSDKTVRIWDVDAGKEIRKLEGHANEVNSVRYSSDGKKLVTASNDETARIWDTDTGKELIKLQGHEPLVTSAVTVPADVASASFSLDGKKVVTASVDETARIWNADTGKELQKLDVSKEWKKTPGQIVAVLSAVFSPDGKKVATGSQYGLALIWDADSGELLHKLVGHKETVNSVAFSPDGKKLATTGDDQTIRIWDVESGKELQKLEGHTEMVYSVVFSPDGKKLVTASWDNTARIWILE